MSASLLTVLDLLNVPLQFYQLIWSSSCCSWALAIYSVISLTLSCRSEDWWSASRPPREDSNIALVCTIYYLHNGARLLPPPYALIPRPRLQGVHIGIHRHYLFLYVVLNEPEALAARLVVGVHQRVLPIWRQYQGVIVGSNHIVPHIAQQLALVLDEQLLLELPEFQHVLGSHTGADDKYLVLADLLLFIGLVLQFFYAQNWLYDKLQFDENSIEISRYFAPFLWIE